MVMPLLLIMALCLSLTGLAIVSVPFVKMIWLQSDIHLLAVLSYLRPIDYALLLGVLIPPLLFVYHEARYNAATQFIHTMPKRMRYGVLALLCVAFGYSMVGAGYIVVGDGGSHLSRIAHIVQALRQGDGLYWDNYYYGGSTLLQFSGPVFHYITAATAVLFHTDATTAVKIVLLLLRVISGFAFYAWLKQLRYSAAVSFLGAIAYAGAFFVSYITMVRVALPQALILALLPLLFISIQRLIDQKRGALSATVLLTITLIGTHQPTAIAAALWALLYYALYTPWRQWLRPFCLTAAWVALGSVYFVVPFLLEKKFTANNFSLQIVQWQWPQWYNVGQLITWGAFGQGRISTAYLGTVPLVLLALGAWRYRQKRLWLIMGLTLCVQFSDVRSTIFTLFFVCMAAAHVLQHTALHRWWGWIFIALVGENILLGARPYLRPDMTPLHNAGIYLAQNFANTRVIEVRQNKDNTLSVPIGPDASVLHLERVQMLRGAHQFDGTLALNGMMATLRHVQNNLQQGRLTPVTQTLLQSYNVGLLVGYKEAAMQLPATFSNAHTPALGDYYSVPNASPVMVSARLQAVPMPAIQTIAPLWFDSFEWHEPDAETALHEVAQFAQRMHITPATMQAAQFLVPQNVLPAYDTQQATPHIALQTYTVTPDKIFLRLHASGQGWARLAHPVTPMHTIMVNQAQVTPINDVFALPIVPIQSGDNEIIISATPSKLRYNCGLITISVVVSALMHMLYQRRRLR